MSRVRNILAVAVVAAAIGWRLDPTLAHKAQRFVATFDRTAKSGQVSFWEGLVYSLIEANEQAVNPHGNA
jgi:hypothetical protein